MEDFSLERTANGDRLQVRMSGPSLLRYPLFNKGTGFTHEERRRLGIEGLLPAEHNDIDRQAERIFSSIFSRHDNVGRNIGLSMLQDRNEVLYYRVLQEHLEDVMPIVYTPTVGEASRYYSRVFRRGRGIFITPEYVGRIEEVLRGAATFSDVRLMVVTDNESILGIGDQGAGGMAISVGKLSLYCAGAGIHPARTLPISLDVGTDNQDLLDDPLYLGYRQPRLRGDVYVALVDEFVAAAKAVFPRVIIQWEDFRKDNALMILDRYRQQVPSFNDDIQGTGAVATACIEAACRVSGQALSDRRIVVYGAGAGGLGIARQLKNRLKADGLSDDTLTRAVLTMDSGGIITAGRDRVDEYKQELAWPEAMADDLDLDSDERRRLVDVVSAYEANVLIGASGQGGAFNEDVVRAMSANSEYPVILPMSNPTSISEAVPVDLDHWTDGTALVATGSPFEPVERGGVKRRVGQANNVFVFPGIGLGAMACDASEITDAMINTAASALAASLSDSDIAERSLVPEVSRLWQVCGDVALAVAAQAINDGVGRDSDTLQEDIDAMRWIPRYPTIECLA